MKPGPALRLGSLQQCRGAGEGASGYALRADVIEGCFPRGRYLVAGTVGGGRHDEVGKTVPGGLPPGFDARDGLGRRRVSDRTTASVDRGDVGDLATSAGQSRAVAQAGTSVHPRRPKGFLRTRLREAAGSRRGQRAVDFRGTAATGPSKVGQIFPHPAVGSRKRVPQVIQKPEPVRPGRETSGQGDGGLLAPPSSKYFGVPRAGDSLRFSGRLLMSSTGTQTEDIALIMRQHCNAFSGSPAAQCARARRFSAFPFGVALCFRVLFRVQCIMSGSV